MSADTHTHTHTQEHIHFHHCRLQSTRIRHRALGDTYRVLPLPLSISFLHESGNRAADTRREGEGGGGDVVTQRSSASTVVATTTATTTTVTTTGPSSPPPPPPRPPPRRVTLYHYYCSSIHYGDIDCSLGPVSTRAYPSEKFFSANVYAIVNFLSYILAVFHSNFLRSVTRSTIYFFDSRPVRAVFRV